jgi:hypothetical protein
MKTPLFLGALLACTSSCVHVNVGTESEFFDVDSPVSAYGTVDALEDWDGDVLDMGVFSDHRGRNEIFHLELGPLFGFGVGFVGARVRVLPLEFGAGSLFYDARPRRTVVVERAPEKEVEETEAAAQPQGAKTATGETKRV